MRLLLDTHVLLWWLAGEARVTAATRATIEDRANEVSISVASLWEIAIKLRVGKLKVEMAIIDSAIDRIGFSRLAIRPNHLVTLIALPIFHRDPFDHLLIAQAIAERATLVSSDEAMAHYPVDIMRP